MSIGKGEIDLASYVEKKEEPILVELEPAANNPANMKISLVLTSYSAEELSEEASRNFGRLDEDANSDSKDKLAIDSDSPEDKKEKEQEEKSFIPSASVLRVKSSDNEETQKDYAKRFRELQQAYTSLKSQLEKAEQRADKLKGKLAEKESETKQLREEVLSLKSSSEVERQVEKMSAQMAEVKEQLKNKSEEAAELARKVKRLQQEAKNRERETENKLREVSEKDNKILELTSQINALKDVTKTMSEKLIQHSPHSPNSNVDVNQTILELSNISASAFYPFALSMFLLSCLVLIYRIFSGV